MTRPAISRLGAASAVCATASGSRADAATVSPGTRRRPDGDAAPGRRRRRHRHQRSGETILAASAPPRSRAHARRAPQERDFPRIGTRTVCRSRAVLPSRCTLTRAPATGHWCRTHPRRPPARPRLARHDLEAPGASADRRRLGRCAAAGDGRNRGPRGRRGEGSNKRDHDRKRSTAQPRHGARNEAIAPLVRAVASACCARLAMTIAAFANSLQIASLAGLDQLVERGGSPAHGGRSCASPCTDRASRS